MANHLGVAVPLCELPGLGFVPDDVAVGASARSSAPRRHLRIPADAIYSYDARDQTRTDHLVEVAKLLAGAR